MRKTLIIDVSQDSDAVAPRCSVKEVFVEISQNSQENTSARVSFLINLQAYDLKGSLIEDQSSPSIPVYCTEENLRRKDIVKNLVSFLSRLIKRNLTLAL